MAPGPAASLLATLSAVSFTSIHPTYPFFPPAAGIAITPCRASVLASSS